MNQAIEDTTGWAIVHPNGWVELTYFRRGMSDEKLATLRRDCTIVRVGLVALEK